MFFRCIEERAERHVRKDTIKACRADPQIESLIVKPDDLNLIPETHIVDVVL